MIRSIANFYKRQQFFVNPLSVFINPNFFSRRGLCNSIRREAPLLKGKLLDFGCGRKPWQSLFQVDEYIGVDIEESGHDHNDSLIDVFYDGNTLPFEDNTFDSVFSSETFEHLFNLDTILMELNRVLKPGGYMLITIPFAWNEHEKPYDFARYTTFGIAAILKKNGFEVIRQNKTTTYFETVCQLLNSFWIESVFPKNKAIRILLQALLLGIPTAFCVLLNKIMPDNKDLYLNQTILAQKV